MSGGRQIFEVIVLRSTCLGWSETVVRSQRAEDVAPYPSEVRR